MHATKTCQSIKMQSKNTCLWWICPGRSLFSKTEIFQKRWAHLLTLEFFLATDERLIYNFALVGEGVQTVNS